MLLCVRPPKQLEMVHIQDLKVGEIKVGFHGRQLTFEEFLRAVNLLLAWEHHYHVKLFLHLDQREMLDQTFVFQC